MLPSRCGRTARIGNEGNALLFLLETEDAYVHFIKRNQKVDLQRIDLEPSLTSYQKCLKCMRDLQKHDRLLFDKANRAFVSYVQAYNKHECNLILRLKDIDLGKLAMGFGLLRMPRMPELKGKTTSSFKEDEIDINSIVYSDKQKEKSRLEKLKVFQESGIWPTTYKRKRKQTESWSEVKKRKLEKQENRKKRKEKKMKQTVATDEKKRQKRKFDEQDIEELAKDIALIKKLKKKKVHLVKIIFKIVTHSNQFFYTDFQFIMFRFPKKNLIQHLELTEDNKYCYLIFFCTYICTKRYPSNK